MGSKRVRLHAYASALLDIATDPRLDDERTLLVATKVAAKRSLALPHEYAGAIVEEREASRWGTLIFLAGEPTLRRVETADIGGDRVDALVGVALGVENGQVVDVAGREAEVADGFVEIDAALQGRVGAPEVDGQLAVDEHPRVVFAEEHELFTAVVAEAGVKLGGEIVS